MLLWWNLPQLYFSDWCWDCIECNVRPRRSLLLTEDKASCVWHPAGWKNALPLVTRSPKNKEATVQERCIHIISKRAPQTSKPKLVFIMVIHTVLRIESSKTCIFLGNTSTARWVILRHWWMWPRWSLLMQSAWTERSYLSVNMADKNQPATAVVQEQVRVSDKARHIPGGRNFIRGIFTTISCRPTVTDRPGIPLITKLLQSGNFSSPTLPQYLENHYVYSNGHRNVKNPFGNVSSIAWTLTLTLHSKIHFIAIVVFHIFYSITLKTNKKENKNNIVGHIFPHWRRKSHRSQVLLLWQKVHEAE